MRGSTVTLTESRFHAERRGRSTARRRRVSEWPLWGYLPVILPLVAVWQQGIVFSQSHGIREAKLDTGEAVYRAACAACHGPDGKGMAQTTLGFAPPETFPDFTDCKATTRETDLDWRAIIHLGGAARGFSEIMPSFTEALTGSQIDSVIGYLRGFCHEQSWPRGELNLPRAMVTEKAFPEDEVVFQTSFNVNRGSAITNDLLYERRVGRRNQFELKAPVSFRRQASRTWFGGIGDITLGYKRPLISRLGSGSIFSLSGEVTLPTGNKSLGLGTGATIVETFGAYGQLLPRHSFLQVQAGAELPVSGQASRALFWRTALGTTLTQGKGFGRLWSPMVEILADRELASQARTNWDMVPQVQVTLNKRQHIRANLGFRFPLNSVGSRSVQLVFYLLWDWFDGGLRDGW